MDFDQIMQEIVNGLSGDFQTDASYLKARMDEYKDHEYGKEIIRACGRLMYEIMPEDMKKEMDAAIQKDELHIDATLEEVRFNVYKKDFNKALSIMESLVRKVKDMEESGAFQNDAVSEYYTFNEAFEEMLFRDLHDTKKDIRRAGIPYAEIYLQYGSLLYDLKRFEDAQAVMAKAVRWNPCNAKIAFEYAESFKVLGDIEAFKAHTIDTFKIAFRPDDVARCYRNLGYYFVEKKLWSEAIACNLMSMQFDRESKSAQSELYYIQQVTKGKIPEPGMKELEKYSKKYGFPIGADRNVLGLAYGYGKHFYEAGQMDGAGYCWKIFYDLTHDDEIKKLLDKLPKE